MLLLGAVAYDPKVVPIWEGICAWLQAHGVDVEPVWFFRYETLVQALVSGGVDVAWHSPLAVVQTERALHRRGRTLRLLAMRDTDQDLTSVIVARRGGPSSLDTLRGRRIAVGAWDSPQATLLPLNHLQANGVRPGKDVDVRTYDLLVGKHGDHVGGERLAARALRDGDVDAAALFDGNLLAFRADGSLPDDAEVIARTGMYDHCAFAALTGHREAELDAWTRVLLTMRWEDPVVRVLFDLEGLREWRPGRTHGIEPLRHAVATLDHEAADRVRRFADTL